MKMPDDRMPSPDSGRMLLALQFHHRGVPTKPPGTTTRVRTLMDAAQLYYRHVITVNDIMSDRRDPSTVRARHIVMYLAKLHTRLSFPKIGILLGGRDHTTIMHGVKRITQKLKLDQALAIEVRAIERIALARNHHAQAPQPSAGDRGAASRERQADEDAHRQRHGLVRRPGRPRKRSGGERVAQADRCETV